MRSAFGAERCPDRDSMKAHRRERRFDPFGKAKNSGRRGQLHGAAGASEHHPRVGQIIGFQGRYGIEKGSMDGNDPMVLADCGDERRSKDGRPPSPQWRARVVAKVAPGRREETASEIGLGRGAGYRIGDIPDPQRRPRSDLKGAVPDR
ncbi:hypothetical protein ACFSUK_18710 [Sphingobium scionense]